MNIRDKILYFFDNVSKKEYKFRDLEPDLYNKFLIITSLYGDQRFFRKIQVIRNTNTYILFRLSQSGKLKWFADYCAKHKIPMSNNQLKYFHIDMDMKEFYKFIHGGFPVCVKCNKDLPSLKVQLYTTLEENNGKYCSKTCQKQSQIDKYKDICAENNSTLVALTSTNSTISCSDCGENFIRNTSNVFYKNMFKCNKCLNSISKGQLEVNSLVNGELEDRNFLEKGIVDIIDHKNKFGIEYDGLMYHSFGLSTNSIFNKPIIDKNIHKRRTEEFESKDYQLFRIWDIEWLNKRAIWESVINCKLNKSKRIYARKCIVKEIGSKEAREFCEVNHLQGYASSSVKLGLFYVDELISVMTFGKTVRSDMELIRFCSKLNTTVVGGASKLLKYFERVYNPEYIDSYANRRWSQGNVYEKLGFEKICITEPNYFYFKSNYDRTGLLYSRHKFTIKNIKKFYAHPGNNLIDVYDGDSELKTMFKNGYRVIYDCGNIKFRKKY